MTTATATTTTTTTEIATLPDVPYTGIIPIATTYRPEIDNAAPLSSLWYDNAAYNAYCSGDYEDAAVIYREQADRDKLISPDDRDTLLAASAAAQAAAAEVRFRPAPEWQEYYDELRSNANRMSAMHALGEDEQREANHFRWPHPNPGPCRSRSCPRR